MPSDVPRLQPSLLPSLYDCVRLPVVDVDVDSLLDVPCVCESVYPREVESPVPLLLDELVPVPSEAPVPDPCEELLFAPMLNP